MSGLGVEVHLVDPHLVHDEWLLQLDRAKLKLAARRLRDRLNAACVHQLEQSWTQWCAAGRAVGYAARLMLRAACRFMSNQLVGGWNRWVEFLVAEKRALNVMCISLGRLRHKRVAQAWATWLQLDLDRVRWSSQEATEARHEQVLKDFRNVTEQSRRLQGDVG